MVSFQVMLLFQVMPTLHPNDLGGPVGNRGFWVGKDEIVMYANK